jgi:hypothetical protein
MILKHLELKQKVFVLTNIILKTKKMFSQVTWQISSFDLKFDEKLLGEVFSTIILKFFKSLSAFLTTGFHNEKNRVQRS